MTGSPIFCSNLRNQRNPSNSNYHMSINNCQAIQKSCIDRKSNAWFTLGDTGFFIACVTSGIFFVKSVCVLCCFLLMEFYLLQLQWSYLASDFLKVLLIYFFLASVGPFKASRPRSLAIIYPSSTWSKSNIYHVSYFKTLWKTQLQLISRKTIY